MLGRFTGTNIMANHHPLFLVLVATLVSSSYTFSFLASLFFIYNYHYCRPRYRCPAYSGFWLQIAPDHYHLFICWFMILRGIFWEHHRGLLHLCFFVFWHDTHGIAVCTFVCRSDLWGWMLCYRCLWWGCFFVGVLPFLQSYEPLLESSSSHSSSTDYSSLFKDPHHKAWLSVTTVLYSTNSIGLFFSLLILSARSLKVCSWWSGR